jgi:Uma2 family endonuclease
MKPETAVRAEERLSQAAFRRWLKQRPAADINHYELIHGRIVMTPPAGWPHGGIGSTLNHLLQSHVRARPLGIVLDASTGFELPSGDTLEPDVSFVSAARFAAGPAPKPGQFLRVVPNLAVEILSRKTKWRDLIDKKDVYAANGVEQYWIVDPAERAITVFHLGPHGYDAGTRLTAGRLRSRLFSDLNATVEDVFALPALPGNSPFER